MVGCESCKKPKEVKMEFKNYSIEELEQANILASKTTNTPDEVAWMYNLYNRVYKTNKQPGCNRCFASVRNQLKQRYRIENGERDK